MVPLCGKRRIKDSDAAWVRDLTYDPTKPKSGSIDTMVDLFLNFVRLAKQYNNKLGEFSSLQCAYDIRHHFPFYVHYTGGKSSDEI